MYILVFFLQGFSLWLGFLLCILIGGFGDGNKYSYVNELLVLDAPFEGLRYLLKISGGLTSGTPNDPENELAHSHFKISLHSSELSSPVDLNGAKRC